MFIGDGFIWCFYMTLAFLLFTWHCFPWQSPSISHLMVSLSISLSFLFIRTLHFSHVYCAICLFRCSCFYFTFHLNAVWLYPLIFILSWFVFGKSTTRLWFAFIAFCYCRWKVVEQYLWLRCEWVRERRILLHKSLIFSRMFYNIIVI